MAFDPDKQGTISSYQPSLHDATAYWLAKMWFGDDREGVAKAKRLLDVTGAGSVPMAGDYATTALRRGDPVEAAGSLLLGALPAVPGAKIAQSPSLQKAMKALDEAIGKLKGPVAQAEAFPTTAKTINLGGIDVPKSQLADDLKALKAKQADPLDEYFKKDNPSNVFEEPRLASPAISHGSARGVDTTHVSSHDFDRFNIGKVGAGEGTIMEGSGIYTSNDPHVPDYYVRQFTDANTKMFPYDLPKQSAVEMVANNLNFMGPGATEKQALASAMSELGDKVLNPGAYHAKDADKILKVVQEWYDRGLPKGAITRPYKYDVNLDVDPAAMPEWQKTLPEQSDKARRLIRDAYLEYPGMTTESMPDKIYAELYHDMYQANLKERGLHGPVNVGSIRFGKDAPILGPKGRGTPGEAAADVSSYLYKRGIPGHKYLPAEGAYGDQGTRNFVSYHHEYMKILNKIKLALAAGVPTAALVSQYGKEDVEAAKQQQ